MRTHQSWRGARRTISVVALAAVTLAFPASAASIAAADPQVQRYSSRALTVTSGVPVAGSTEGVLDGSGATTNPGWTAASSAGPIAVRRVTGVSGPFTAKTAMALSRTAAGPGTGGWAFALVPLRSPQTFFAVGKVYRMEAWVRDTRASGASIGMLLANGNYGHRPADAAVYGKYTDAAWHLITRTFVATAPGWADTSVYLGLPANGGFAFEVTGVSVKDFSAALPARTDTVPERVVSFAGGAGTSPSAADWNFETGGHGWGNNEVQTYTRSTDNAALTGTGKLAITARHQRVRGTDGVVRDFTSARLTTEGKVTVRAGSYVEAEIVAPVGAGVWPAFWTVGVNSRTVGWPAGGELDIFEGWGATPTLAHSAMHLAKAGAPKVDMPYGWGEAGGTTNLGESLDARPHRYGVYFDRNVVRFYIDRKPTMTVWAADAISAGRTWPFGGDQFLILNVAVATGTSPAMTTLPRTMTVGDIAIHEGGTPF
ncbi:glycoside hydrolase family 16 protein [Catenuloplanes atrovinosus]|uniref:Beta-glucanase (GH16 family) n=1 Tax=Catenuloplanes atrovinosus TaxID=137266 RepID=A0AAE3YRR5_9ACTN|nr:glycoside hydrolase family 16 protein [Catenuloplanes atrovinosus]MDR7277149.1 beta-glucanase (GH16 family) [Catenuloplanes atrovinosus]